MTPTRQPPTTAARFNRALIANALLDPFNVVLLAVVLIAGILLGVFAFTLPVARRRSTSPARRARTSTRTWRTRCSSASARSTASRSRPAALELRAQDFAPPIGQLLEQARAREARIRDAIARAELPYDEVADEIDRFVARDGVDRNARPAAVGGAVGHPS